VLAGRSPGLHTARTRPDCVRGDKACSSRVIRGHLRDRGITAVIPEPVNQAGHRGCNVVERRFNLLEQWRGLATRYYVTGQVAE
jgi:hypothetical protein